VTTFTKGTFSWSALGGTSIEPTVSTIQDQKTASSSTPEISFSTTPQGNIFIYVAGTSAYVTNARYTAINTAITFTFNEGLFQREGAVPVAYEWDFGDGEKAWGNPVVHTYIVENTNCQAVLKVTDHLGKNHYTRRQMYLTS